VGTTGVVPVVAHPTTRRNAFVADGSFEMLAGGRARSSRIGASRYDPDPSEFSAESHWLAFAYSSGRLARVGFTA
jgi:hypothetical protein